MTWLSYKLTEADLISPFVYLIEILALGAMRGHLEGWTLPRIDTCLVRIICNWNDCVKSHYQVY